MHTRIKVLVAVLLTLCVAVLLVDLRLGHVALVTGFVEGAATDAGLACSGRHCVCVYL